ncbi:hypothetical protein [Amycolatopsis aidingensis]|uniref:hypothetical protein n=1 Tax=Amycolatopsis aidingensis TaxID=2842453 RepID=UPI001C0C0394|nr:hypothetical protein [Amycolatopsis aidingensis]
MTAGKRARGNDLARVSKREHPPAERATTRRATGRTVLVCALMLGLAGTSLACDTTDAPPETEHAASRWSEPSTLPPLPTPSEPKLPDLEGVPVVCSGQDGQPRRKLCWPESVTIAGLQDTIRFHEYRCRPAEVTPDVTTCENPTRGTGNHQLVLRSPAEGSQRIEHVKILGFQEGATDSTTPDTYSKILRDALVQEVSYLAPSLFPTPEISNAVRDWLHTHIREGSCAEGAQSETLFGYKLACGPPQHTMTKSKDGVPISSWSQALYLDTPIRTEVPGLKDSHQ